MTRFLPLVLCFLAWPSSAGADTSAFSIGSKPSWFVLVGPNIGATALADDQGLRLGGELSLARLNDGQSMGLYADLLYDFGLDAPVMSAGPEFGFNLGDRKTLPADGSIQVPFSLGLDGGVVMRLADEAELGATGRLSLGIAGLVSLYGRYSFFDAATNEHMLSFGILIKSPLLSPF